MPATIIVPLIMASLFTAGCILIGKLERYAEHITGVLGSAFFIIATFAALTLVERYANEITRPDPRVTIKQVQTPRATPQLADLGLVGVR